MTSLYVHIPFCARKCAYCDFPSFAGKLELADAYLDALAREAERYRGMKIGTVYIGGGTPTMLSPAQLRRLLTIVRDNFGLDPDAEFSMESNPGTLSEDKLGTMLDGGVNRLSMGAQAMQDPLLALLGRIHTARDVLLSVESARKAGFTNINLDLMYGLPGQSPRMMRESVRLAAETGVTHISAYSLINEEGTPLTRAIERGEILAPNEDELDEIETAAREELVYRGFRRYEISNFARAGYECRHNLVYWTRGDYLGIGLSSHSFLNGDRFSNTCDLSRYLSGETETARQTIGAREAEFEQIMLETRLTRGLDIESFNRRFQTDFYRKYEKQVRTLVDHGCADAEKENFRLTERGLNIQNTCITLLTKDN